MLNSNDLPSSTRSIRRRTSLLEKSRNWVNRTFLRVVISKPD